eukprot:jgi/Tetstr1/433995/TSEL_023169.t1
MGVQVRPSLPEDAQRVTALKSRLRGGADPNTYCADVQPEWLMENAALCLTAVGESSETPVGFLAIFNYATHKEASVAPVQSDEKSEWLKMQAEEMGYTQKQTAYVKILFAAEKDADAIARALVHSAFARLADVDVVLWASPAPMDSAAMAGVLRWFTLRRESDVEALWVYGVERAAVLPPLLVRSAVVDDHDDLAPVLQRGEQRYPAFSQLPDDTSPGSEFALARVIDSQDANNLVLVAEVGGKMVGTMVCTANLDLAIVHQSFDLHAYDNLLPEELYERQLTSVKEAVLKQKRDVAEAERQERIDTRRRDREEENEARRMKREAFIEEYEADYAQKFAEAEEQMRALAKQKGRRGKLPEPMPKDPPPPPLPDDMKDLGEDHHVEPEVEVSTTEEEVRSSMMTGEYAVEAVSLAEQLCFAIVVYCLDPEFESQWQAMLDEAFRHFSDKDYCLVMLPHDSKVPPMLSDFTRVAPIPATKAPEQLYIFHRYGLLKNFEVRLAGDGDREAIAELTAGMSNQPEVLESFSSTLEKGGAVVALVDGQVVGVATLILGVNFDLLQSNFLLSARIQMSHVPPDSLAEVDMVVINPIFTHRKRDLLLGCLDTLSCSVLFYALPPGTEKPDVLVEFSQVPGRSRMASEDDAFALYCFTRRISQMRRRIVNSQVVVIGASECGISAIEQLLCNPRLEFTSIALVAPGGITVGGAGSTYSSQDISKIGLEAQVSMVDAEMIGLDREAQVVYLSTGGSLSYEILVLTAGLQDQALKRITRSAEIDAPVVTLEELVSELEPSFAETLSSCIVYGATLEAYQAMEVLTARGCVLDAITHVLPPEGHVGPSFVVPVLAKKIELDLPDTEIMTLVKVESMDGGSAVNATFTYINADNMENVMATRSTQLLVMADAKDVDVSLFECVNGASLVYDGRIVVDGAFRTNDPSIYAAGTVARFSRELALNVNQEFYNSKEVGARLAESICGLYGVGSQRPAELPSLGGAKVVGTDLPGGGSIIYVGTPNAIAHPGMDPQYGGQKVFTSTETGYCQLVLDENMVVESFIYAGPMQVDGATYQGIVGISSKYLNDLVAKWEAGLVPDLIEYLTQNWALLYQHDRFANLRHNVLASTKHLHDPAGDNDGIKSVAVDMLMTFIRSHLAELPSCNLPPELLTALR